MVVDLIFGLLLALAVFTGWTGGLVGRLVSWVGFTAAAMATARWATVTLDALNITGKHQRLGAASVAVVLGGVFGHAVGWRVARGLRSLVPRPLRWLDSLAGVVVGIGAVVLLVWILAPALLSVRGWPQDQARASKAIEVVERWAPTPPYGGSLLGRLTQDWGVVPTFGSDTPAVDVGELPSEIVISAEVLEAAAASIIRVSAVACSQRQNGTGFVISPGMALTNAHIVAGSQKVEIALPGRTLEQASVLAFDPERDLALLRVDSTIVPLQLESPLAGQLAGVIGHPGGGPLRTVPIRLVERVTAHARDLHDSVDTTRKVWFAAAKLQTGDSGAPVIDTNGAVVAVIFAVAPPNASDYERTAYALDRSEIAGFMAEVTAFGDRTVVNTGKCLG
ncbi:MAG: hypothetical protein CL434_03735 [Acidimicrobiaceae bacterium]|nr:hypothetical protein [Acidimicrobiaceae bacterium]